ncbi:MAG TPA: VWA domain-containing protein, partial [Ignavibacteriaceae bacterium]
ALKNNDKVGLILFTDKIEKFVPPRKGRKHVLRIIREVLSFEPEGKATNIKGALEFMNNAIKKKSISFLISDFLDEGYEKILRIVGRKHDLIGIVLDDRREKEIPNIGLVKLVDAESGIERWIDTSSTRVRTQIIADQKEREKNRNSIFMKSGLDRIEVTTGSNYIQPLVQFFRRREKRW